MERTCFLLGKTSFILIDSNDLIEHHKMLHSRCLQMAAEVFVPGMHVQQQVGQTSGAHGGGLRLWLPRRDGRWRD